MTAIPDVQLSHQSPSEHAPTFASPPPRPCVACGGHRVQPLFRDLVRCETCGMVYYPKRLSAEEVATMYSSEYFAGGPYFDYVGDRPVHEANFRARVRQLAAWLPAGRSLFEIGCSYGFFVELARRRWRVRGCDIAAEPARYARGVLGLDVVHADFLDVPLSRGEADAFCLWDTIEHLEDPGSYLQRIQELLEPGGLLALTTGDIGSWLARWQGPRGRQIHPPDHLWYFSRPTMQRTLERFGFEMIWFRHVGIARGLGQIVFSLTSLGRPTPSPIVRACTKLGLHRLKLWMNTGDLMMVVGRKKNAE